MENNDVKLIIANNIIKYRKEKGLTQLELAEMINYSDKTLSKWERAEAVPDVVTLIQLAKIFEISVDQLISNKPIDQNRFVVKKKGLSRHKIVSITLLSISIVWVVATFCFVLLNLLPKDFTTTNFKPWMCFIYAIPVSAIVLLVFTGIWGNNIDHFFTTSVLIWTLVLSIAITFSQTKGIYLLYILAIPVQIMAFLYFCILKRKKKKKSLD